MYDTSDIRKGLKVLMDGNPWTIIEFQFVKPGKGAAFTRTKFKNLLNGTTKEMNIRSGEKLEPANVDQREMQFLYKEAGDLVFMDQTSYEQVSISADMVGAAAAGFVPALWGGPGSLALKARGSMNITLQPAHS